MEAQSLQSVWFWLLVVVLLAYSMLDGVDLGVAMLAPFQRRSEERARLMRVIWPFWDGNEGWLLIGGASLCVLFPQAFATVQNGFGVAVALLMVMLVMRAVIFERRHLSVRHKVLWERMYAMLSLLLVLLLCIALGNAIYGVPLTADRRYAGDVFTVLHPYPLLVGALGVAMAALQGAAHASTRFEGPMVQSMIRAGVRAWSVVCLLFIAFSFYTAFGIEGVAELPAFWGCAFVCIALLAAIRHAIRTANPRMFSWLTSAFVAGVWLVIGAAQYPVLVRDSAAGAHITVFDSVAQAGALGLGAVLALTGIVVIAGFTVYMHRAFRGTVKQNEGY